MSFSFNITSENSLQLIALKGNLMSKEQAQPLMDEMDHLFSEGQTKIIVNLSQMQYMNSTGLNILITIFTRTKNNGGEAIISNVPKKISELLVITKLDSIFNIAETIEEAKKKLREVQRGKFCLNNAKNFIEGKVDMTSRGAAYIVVEGREKDIYIHPKNTNKRMSSTVLFLCHLGCSIPAI